MIRDSFIISITPAKDDATMKGSMVNLKRFGCASYSRSEVDGLVGYSPIAMAKNAIGMAIACESMVPVLLCKWCHAGRYSGGSGTVKDPQRGRDSWTSAFWRQLNFNKVAVLEENEVHQFPLVRNRLSFGNKKISDKRDSSKQAKVRLVTRQKLERL